jgi:hypothetical protein
MRRLMTVLVSTVLFCFCGPSALGAPSSGGSPSRVPFEPPGPNIALVSGTAGRLNWTMFVLNRPDRPRSEPCVQVASSIRGSGGALGGGVSCARRPLDGRMPPLISVSDSRVARTSVIGLAFGLNVKSLEVETGDRSVRRVAPDRLDHAQSAQIDLRSFGFASIVLPRNTCYRRILGLSAKHIKVFALHQEACS